MSVSIPPCLTGEVRTMNGESAVSGMLTLAQASHILNVHINTLRRWSDKGKIVAYRVGPAQHRRFRRADIGALLMDRTEDAKVDAHAISPR